MHWWKLLHWFHSNLVWSWLLRMAFKFVKLCRFLEFWWNWTYKFVSRGQFPCKANDMHCRHLLWNRLIIFFGFVKLCRFLEFWWNWTYKFVSRGQFPCKANDMHCRHLLWNRLIIFIQIWYAATLAGCLSSLLSTCTCCSLQPEQNTEWDCKIKFKFNVSAKQCGPWTSSLCQFEQKTCKYFFLFILFQLSKIKYDYFVVFPKSVSCVWYTWL